MRSANPGSQARAVNARLHDLAGLLTSLIFVVPIAFVFLWMVSMSFKTQVEISSATPALLPAQPTTAWYSDLLGRMPFAQYLFNSLIVGAGATGLGLLFGLPAAYAIARWKLTSTLR